MRPSHFFVSASHVMHDYGWLDGTGFVDLE